MNASVDVGTLLPHGPSMVLLDAVESWGREDIVCVATSHRRVDNPLRRGGRLSSLALVEYAAQAMAVHGALTGDGVARSGVLGSVRRFRREVEHLDGLGDPLRIVAHLRRGEANSAVYAFSVSAGGCEIASGQAAVFYSTEEPG